MHEEALFRFSYVYRGVVRADDWTRTRGSRDNDVVVVVHHPPPKRLNVAERNFRTALTVHNHFSSFSSRRIVALWLNIS